MALHDLTPQLRTRLSRLERVVGWFVTLATLLLLFGLGYYVYQVAQRKGWFLTKVPYFTFVRNATGLKVGDPIRLMGFPAGEITEITAQPPDDPYFNVYIQFRVKEPFYGYLWEDSRARVTSIDFLGNRSIEVTKGTNGAPTYLFYQLDQFTVREASDQLLGKTNYAFGQEVLDKSGTNVLAKPLDRLNKPALLRLAETGAATLYVFNTAVQKKVPTAMWHFKLGRYEPVPKNNKGYWIQVLESPALSERLEKVVDSVEAALPNFLSLTNKLVRVLTNADNIITHTDDLLVSAKPILTNLAQITANLSGPKGSLGDWILPTNINAQLQLTLGSANSTIATAQTNLNVLSSNIVVSLQNVANLTSNLHAQVDANGLILTEISDLIIHTDDMMQGLKRHWLLKSAFGPVTNVPPQSILQPRIGGEK